MRLPVSIISFSNSFRKALKIRFSGSPVLSAISASVNPLPESSRVEITSFSILLNLAIATTYTCSCSFQAASSFSSCESLFPLLFLSISGMKSACTCVCELKVQIIVARTKFEPVKIHDRTGCSVCSEESTYLRLWRARCVHSSL